MSTLSAEELAFSSGVAGQTGLDQTVVDAWVGQECGFGKTKADHNYLNIGPGRSYPSVAAAVVATVSVINQSNMAGILAAVPAGPLAQIKAIEASPWDCGKYGGTVPGPGGCMTVPGNDLERTWDGYVGSAGATGPPIHIPGVPDALSNAPGNIVSGASSVFDLQGGLGKVLLTIVFVIGGLGLVALGLARLTEATPGEHLDRLNKILPAVATAAAI